MRKINVTKRLAVVIMAKVLKMQAMKYTIL